MELLYSELPMTRHTMKITYRKPHLFDKAAEEQDQMGWKLTVKGLLSTVWSNIQENEYTRIREKEPLDVWYTGTWWSKHISKNIIFWALNEWQRRNEHLHREREVRLKEKERGKCQEDVMELYRQQEEEPIKKLKRYYRLPLIERLQQNPRRQKQWIDTIRALKDKQAIQNSKNKV